MIYSIIFACTMNLMVCVPLPEYTRQFETPTGCRIYVAAMRYQYWQRRDPQHPFPVGRCRPWYE